MLLYIQAISIFLFFDIFCATCSSTFDLAQANIAVRLSGIAYCGKERYGNYTFRGNLKGFNVTKLIWDESSDTEGFIG